MCKQISGGLLAVLFLAGYVVAEGSREARSGHRRISPTDRTASSTSVKNDGKDCPVAKQIASCLLLSTQEVVLVSQYAANRVQNADVKAFTRSLAADHTQFASQFQRLVPQAISTEALAQRVSEVCSGDLNSPYRWTGGKNASGKASDTSTPRIQRPTLSGDQPQGGTDSGWNNPPASSRSMKTESHSGKHSRAKDSKTSSGEAKNLVQVYSNIQQNVAANSICLTTTELAQFQNDRFDKAFLSQQIGAHIGLLAKCKAMKPYVSGELKTLVLSVEKTAQNHLDQANSILRNWDPTEVSRN